jgi:hypothetical protein
MGCSEAWGKLIHEKKPEVENLVALSLLMYQKKYIIISCRLALQPTVHTIY